MSADEQKWNNSSQNDVNVEAKYHSGNSYLSIAKVV